MTRVKPGSPESLIATTPGVGDHRTAHEQAGLNLIDASHALTQSNDGGNRTATDTHRTTPPNLPSLPEVALAGDLTGAVRNPVQGRSTGTAEVTAKADHVTEPQGSAAKHQDHPATGKPAETHVAGKDHSTTGKPAETHVAGKDHSTTGKPAETPVVYQDHPATGKPAETHVAGKDHSTTGKPAETHVAGKDHSTTGKPAETPVVHQDHPATGKPAETHVAGKDHSTTGKPAETPVVHQDQPATGKPAETHVAGKDHSTTGKPAETPVVHQDHSATGKPAETPVVHQDHPATSKPAETPVVHQDHSATGKPAETPVVHQDHPATSKPAETPVVHQDHSATGKPAETPVVHQDHLATPAHPAEVAHAATPSHPADVAHAATPAHPADVAHAATPANPAEAAHAATPAHPAEAAHPATPAPHTTDDGHSTIAPHALDDGRLPTEKHVNHTAEQRALSGTAVVSKAVGKAAPAPVSDVPAKQDGIRTSDIAMASNQQLRTRSAELETKESESSKKSRDKDTSQAEFLASQRELVLDYSRKGTSSTEGTRTTGGGMTRGDVSGLSATFGRNSDDTVPGLMDQKTFARMFGTVTADQIMQQNGLLQPNGSRADFVINASGDIVNLSTGRTEVALSHSRHRGSAESSARGSDAIGNSVETSRMPNGLSTSQSPSDLSSLINQAPQDRSIFSGTYNPANVAAGLHATTGGHSGSSKTSHSSTEPGSGKTDPSAAAGQNNALPAVNGNGKSDPTAVAGNISMASNAAGPTNGGAGNSAGNNNDPVLTGGSATKNGSDPSTGISKASGSGATPANGQPDPTGQKNATGQSDPNGQSNVAGKPDPTGQTTTAGQSDPNGQKSAQGQTDPNGQTSAPGHSDPNGQASTSHQGPNQGVVIGGDQTGQLPAYGLPEPAGGNLIGLLGPILFGLGEGLLSSGGGGKVGRINVHIPVEYGPGSLSLLNQFPGTFTIGENSYTGSNNSSPSSNPVAESVQPSGSPQYIDGDQIAINPSYQVNFEPNQGYQGPYLLNQNTNSVDQSLDSINQTIDSSTYSVSGIDPANSSNPSGLNGSDPGMPGAGSGGNPLKAAIQYDASADPTPSASPAMGPSINEGGSVNGSTPSVDLINLGDPANFNPNVPSPANQTPGTPAVGDAAQQLPDKSDSINKQKPFNPNDSRISANPDALDFANQIPGNPDKSNDSYQLVDGAEPFISDNNQAWQDAGSPPADDWQLSDMAQAEHYHRRRHLGNLDSDGVANNTDDTNDFVRREIAEPDYSTDGYPDSIGRSEVVSDGNGGISTPEELDNYGASAENAELELKRRQLQEELELNQRQEQERVEKEGEIQRANTIKQNQAQSQSQEEGEEQAKRLLALLQMQEEQSRRDNQQKRYLVKRGDTLEKIALAIFQDVSLVPLIYALNKSLIERKMVDGKPVYFVKENTLLTLPSARMIREWRQKRTLHTFVPQTSSLCHDLENEAAKQRRANIEKYLGPLNALSDSEEHLRIPVRLGDTLRSIAMKHPVLGDVGLWRLLAECNALSTAVDAKGVPVAALKRGSSLLLPSPDTIAAYKTTLRKNDQPIAPRHALKAAMNRRQNIVKEENESAPPMNSGTTLLEGQSLTSAVDSNVSFFDGCFIEKLSASCRIVEVTSGAGKSRKIRSQLEVLFDSVWNPVLTYEASEGASVRYEHALDGTVSTMPIDLPAEAVIQLIRNDLHTNWHGYRQKFLRKVPLKYESRALTQAKTELQDREIIDRATLVRVGVAHNS